MRMKQVVLSALIIVGVVFLTVASVRAHHSFAAEFDANKPIKVVGTLVRVEWTNPHTWFHFDVKTPDGKVERWMIEGGGPGSLSRRGFGKDYLKPGTEITIEGYMSKAIPRRANGRALTLPNGQHLFVGSSGTGAPEDNRDPSEQR